MSNHLHKCSGLYNLEQIKNQQQIKGKDKKGKLYYIYYYKYYMQNFITKFLYYLHNKCIKVM